MSLFSICNISFSCPQNVSGEFQLQMAWQQLFLFSEAAQHGPLLYVPGAGFIRVCDVTNLGSNSL